MHSFTLDYRDESTTCEAFVAVPDAGPARRPVVLVAHAWAGQDDFARRKARGLAELGYVGFALDTYGKGRRGNSPAENAALMQPFLDDRAMLRARLEAGMRAASALTDVDATRVGAIGFCFGGLCALDMARAAWPNLRGVVSFHGLFMPPKLGPQPTIRAKVLALHGFDDPLAPPETMVAFARELTDAGADWQLHAYGHTSHAFTNPLAADPTNGMMYRADADSRSWCAMAAFLREALA